MKTTKFEAILTPVACCFLSRVPPVAIDSFCFVERQWLRAALRRAVRLTLAFRTSNSVTRVSLCREYKRPIAIARPARSIERNFNFKRSLPVRRPYSSYLLIPSNSFRFAASTLAVNTRPICTICAPVLTVTIVQIRSPCV